MWKLEEQRRPDKVVKAVESKVDQLGLELERLRERDIKEEKAATEHQRVVRAGIEDLKTSAGKIHEKVDRIDTSGIERSTKRIEEGLNQVSAEMTALRLEIKASPERVVQALRRLSTEKNVGWTKRQRIKYDLARVGRILDAAEKADFLTRAIQNYGPAVIAALNTILKTISP